MKPDKALVFIALAIRLRDNATKLTDEEFVALLKEVASYGVMSNRQLAKLAKNRMNHVAISRMMSKTSKAGGNLNGSDLEKIRGLIFSRSVRKTDYKLAREIVDNGTSYGMLYRIARVHWKYINRYERANGLIHEEGTVQ